MTIVIMRKLFPSSSWRRAFADALIKLRPDMNPDAADEISDTAYDTLSGLLPDDAAMHFAQGAGPSAGAVVTPAGPRRAGS